MDVSEDAEMEGFMNVRNCRKCGRIFNYVVGPLQCPVCREKMEEKFLEVKEFIKENPGVGIAEVSTECDVETSQIQRWLREERLQLTENSAIYLNCESCGEPIRFGRFCNKCKTNMTKEFNEAFGMNKEKQEPEHKKPSGSAKGKMRYLQ